MRKNGAPTRVEDMAKDDTGASQPAGRAFLAAGGEMGRLTRAFDWASTPLGPPEGWPQSLRTTVRLLLNTRHPMFIWWGPELIQFYNDAYSETMGPERHPSALGQPGRECWQEIWHIIGPQIDYVMAGKGATWHEDQLVPMTRHGGRENVWWTYGFSPIDDEAGNVGGVLVVCNDVTERILADQRREMLARELSHRVKNTLATVQAIASQTLQGDIGIEEARNAFTARLMALSGVQDILTGAPGSDAELSRVVAGALEHHGMDRFTVDGPPVRLMPTAVTAMAMALHELSTNAAKYGALSGPDGRVTLEWDIRSPDDGEPIFAFRWRESGGPPVSPPKRRGFGSRLIERGITMELDGEATITYEPDGVVCVIEAPLSGLTGERGRGS